MVKKPWPRKQDIWTLPFISFWLHLSPLISLDFSLLVWKTHCSLWSLSFYAALTFSTLIGESRSSIFRKEGIYLLYQISVHGSSPLNKPFSFFVDFRVNCEYQYMPVLNISACLSPPRIQHFFVVLLCEVNFTCRETLVMSAPFSEPW